MKKILLIIAIILALTISGCIAPSDSTFELEHDTTELPDDVAVEPTDDTESDDIETSNDTNVSDETTTDNGQINMDGPRAAIVDETDTEVPAIAASTPNDLRIGAFNIQVFGVSKASKPEVMDVLADIVRTYDMIAIQEIRDASQTALPELVELVNSDGSSYDYVVSERLGRTSSKEQYAYIYDTTTIEITGEPEIYPEPEGTDPFHREPYICSIQAVDGDYDAVFMVIHTDPDEATEEINALDDVLLYSREKYPDEEDHIIMGDLNADGRYFDVDEPCDLDSCEWLISDSCDTTTKSTICAYDRIIMTDSSDVTENYGIFRYDTEYNLSEDMTVAVSDHYPIYMDINCVGDLDE